MWAIGVDGSNARQLAAGLGVVAFEAGPTAYASIEWSPDGRSILLSTTGDRGRAITIVATDGSNSVRTLALDLRAEGPTWRPPAGDMILFRGRTAFGYGLYTVRPDGSGLRELVPATGLDSFDALFFGWSPDGRQVIYQAVDPSRPRLLYVTGADGSNPHPITEGESVGCLWSPDGTKIAFLDASDPAGVSAAVVGADGSGLRKLAGSSAGMLRWTPDGTKILLLPDAGGPLLLLDPGGGPSRPVSGIEGTLPDWQRLAP